ncbi:hypothetical protein [Bradyrhizobium sp. CCBAU 45389]|uniref:hypothetical protein n=1 Tax=Bradyrhizobium sp. CCBAU 45389 TaxID=858429 RepID=UPI003FA49998
MRNRTIRFVQGGLTLMRGGYRKKSCGLGAGTGSVVPQGAENRSLHIRHPSPKSCSSMMTAHTPA